MKDNCKNSGDLRAQVLIEALPYIRRFHENIIVIKYGGSVMNSDELTDSLIQDIVLLKLVGFRPIIVHGGGKKISRWVEISGKEPKFVDGLRVTDEETVEIAQMVLNGINKNLVMAVQKFGVRACGLSGMDGGMLKVTKKMPGGKDIGFVGDIQEVNTDIINQMLEDDYIPIICPIGYDKDYKAYNINADDAAYSIASAIKAAKLAFLTDVEGLYEDYEDKDSLISEITISQAQNLIDNGEIKGGMLPKLKNCISAIRNGVSRVHILDGRIEHSLLLEIFTHKGVGTAILGDEEEKFFGNN